MYIAVTTTRPRDSKTSLMDSWCIDWKTSSNTGKLATRAEIIPIWRLLAPVLERRTNWLVTSKLTNTQINGTTSSGSGSRSGSVSIKKTGPETYRHKSMQYLAIVALCVWSCTVQVYKILSRQKPKILNVLNITKQLKSIAVDTMLRLIITGARTTNPLLK